jgi:hypothetical protein
MFPEPVLAALSEGQRVVAHLAVVLLVPIAIGLFYVVRKVRRED